jgi:hypothetical protein
MKESTFYIAVIIFGCVALGLLQGGSYRMIAYDSVMNIVVFAVIGIALGIFNKLK